MAARFDKEARDRLGRIDDSLSFFVNALRAMDSLEPYDQGRIANTISELGSDLNEIIDPSKPPATMRLIRRRSTRPRCPSMTGERSWHIAQCRTTSAATSSTTL